MDIEKAIQDVADTITHQRAVLDIVQAALDAVRQRQLQLGAAQDQLAGQAADTAAHVRALLSTLGVADLPT